MGMMPVGGVLIKLRSAVTFAAWRPALISMLALVIEQGFHALFGGFWSTVIVSAIAEHQVNTCVGIPAI
jgi:hypothetical protein